MSSTPVNIPDFDFAKFYYGEILESLIEFKRQYVPEMTDETPYEPFIQLLRAFALVGHLNNTTLDLIANEAYLSTAKLVESVREHLKLIDYQLRPAVPSNADEVFELAGARAVSTTIIPENALFATVETATDPSVFFEVLSALTIDASNELSYVLGEDDSAFTDYTTEANAGTTWQPWSAVDVGDKIYFGHKHVMWDKLGFDDVNTLGASFTGAFEYYGNHFKTIAPTSVTDLGTTLKVNVDSLLGTSNRAGATVRVTLNSSGAYEDITSTWDGSNNFATTANWLGQSDAPSEDEADYTLSSDWYEVSDLVDGTVDFTVDDETASYTLPQTLTDYWQETSVDGKTAYWIRYRVITESSPTAPIFTTTTIDTGKQYVLSSVTQGQTKLDNPLGTGNGQANQTFETSSDYFILNSQTVTVDGDEWVAVDDFLSSTPTSKHYTVSLGDNDRATIEFGDGVTGSIPSNGDLITCEYRYNAELDGNVGRSTITSDKTGLIYINNVWNPRPASGWAASQGSSELSLEQAKIAGPASLRIKDVALNADDVAILAADYVDDTGASPFTRATAFEGTFGPKTIELIVVSGGGAPASTDTLEAVEKYFNGDKTSDPVKPQRIIANQELTAQNYTQQSIDITATVYGDVEQSIVEDALNNLLQPEALDDDGITYLWDFGGEVSVSRLIHEIFKLDESIWDVNITIPSGNIELSSRALPVAGSISITVESS